MSSDKDARHDPQHAQSLNGFPDHSSDSEFPNTLGQDIRNFNYSAATEAINSMDRELQVLYEKYLELGVRSHLLEVDLATQFSPDMVLALEELNESRKACHHEVEEFAHFGEDAELQAETNENASEHEEATTTTTDKREQDEDLK